ncbi:hypothetical protein EUA06_09485 [Nocardioides glacieisoli]|uniref:Uncharacterized protein n=1 Tax=Nocardioides glacieisoli TaxID=1168730 RepID=A0A4Q2RRD6_9ACTN|nr:hypothetical protein [Nocardioides glacieisoli]RYB91540.1 hypothetical protein EUA06_09485 [Nocardioides glacieisoli]
MKVSRRWSGRIGGAVVLAAIGYAVAIWLDFEPRPFPYAVWALVVIAMTYLLIDTVEAPVSHWQHQVPHHRSDRVDEVTSDLRVLSSHQHADHPSTALAERLVALARGRDPDLAAEIQRDLTGRDRIRPADIDTILTRIEESRDRR